ncbi:uncharacterized protein LOC114304879, partial [Camellia sinensis]|uniref:uncharacterized protein LOC114304879 n=1 Tax=Camellia sinensis TaxID=4442 RepID=UPI00103636AA
MIQDNILVSHEAFHSLKLKKVGTVGHMAIKLDFNKAYDRIKWDFLAAVLKKMGFHSMWVQWVMECVSTISFSVCANGEKKASFIPTRGLRQGDPLSPYLFILVADVLFNLLPKNLRERQISGFKIASSICAISGLKVSHSNARYLGLPSFRGRSKPEAYEFLIEKVVSKLQGWKMKLLSQVARGNFDKGGSTDDSLVPSHPDFGVTSLKPVGYETERMEDAINTNKSWKLDVTLRYKLLPLSLLLWPLWKILKFGIMNQK